MRNISKQGALREEARQFGRLLLDLGRRRGLRDPVACNCEGGNLTPSQVHVLIWLGADAALTMGELARRQGITEKTITGIVDRMEEAGLVARERDQEDRRVVRVRLAAKGEAIYGEVREHLLGKFEGFLRLLEAEDRKALFRILEKLRDRLAATAAEVGGRRKESA